MHKLTACIVASMAMAPMLCRADDYVIIDLANGGREEAASFDQTDAAFRTNKLVLKKVEA